MLRNFHYHTQNFDATWLGGGWLVWDNSWTHTNSAPGEPRWRKCGAPGGKVPWWSHIAKYEHLGPSHASLEGRSRGARHRAAIAHPFTPC